MECFQNIQVNLMYIPKYELRHSMVFPMLELHLIFMMEFENISEQKEINYQITFNNLLIKFYLS